MTTKELIKALLDLPSECLDQEVFFSFSTDYGHSNQIIDDVSQEDYKDWTYKESKPGVRLG